MYSPALQAAANNINDCVLQQCSLPGQYGHCLHQRSVLHPVFCLVYYYCWRLITFDAFQTVFNLHNEKICLCLRGTQRVFVIS